MSRRVMFCETCSLWECDSEHPFIFKSGDHFLLVKHCQDGAIDVEGGGGPGAIIPFLNLLRSRWVGIDINLNKIQIAGLEPGSRPPAARAPAGAVHHNTTCGQFFAGLGCFYRRVQRRFGIDAPQHTEKFLVVRLQVDIVYINITDDSPLIQDKQCPFRISF